MKTKVALCPKKASFSFTFFFLKRGKGKSPPPPETMTLSCCQHLRSPLLLMRCIILISIIGDVQLLQARGQDQAAAESTRQCYQHEHECASDLLIDGAAVANTDGFYAWSPSNTKLLSVLFPNSIQLKSAWEFHPLLSKISYSHDDLDGTSTPTRQHQHASREYIPTIFHNRSSISSWPSSFKYSHDKGMIPDDPILSLCSVGDVPKLLQPEQPLIHGSDYKVVKKVTLPPTHTNAGEEYMGMLPKPHYSIQEVLHYFHYKGESM